MRRAVALGVLGVALAVPGAARAAGETVTLEAGRSVVLHGTVVRLSGLVAPAGDGISVELLRRTGSGESLLSTVEPGDGGVFSVGLRLKKPGPFFARATFPAEGGGDPAVVESADVSVKIKPRLKASFAGSSVVGHELYLRGRLKPANAGVLRRTIRGETRRVRTGPYGGFKIKVPSGRALPVRVRLAVDPDDGYTRRAVVKRKELSLPYLSTGSSGLAVRALKRQLRAQHYSLRGVNRSYGTDTAQAVLAFQKVHGLARTGRVTPGLWRLLARSSTPEARVPRGNHIEISKTKQVIYEVRKGKVVNVIHTSTGRTSNTPVGTWRIYSKTPGFNGSNMYYSLFFLRGFAIHGYHSVPSWPASAGCARIPLWAAPGLYARWGYGSKIIVFA